MTAYAVTLTLSWGLSVQGGHSHSLTVWYTNSNYDSTGGTYTEIGRTSTSISTNSVGDHTHGVGMNGAGGHNHTFTGNSIGSGTAHNNLPPSKAAYCWVRTA
jgi:hypothetical protein